MSNNRERSWPSGQTTSTPSLISVHDVKQPVETQVFFTTRALPVWISPSEPSRGPGKPAGEPGSYHDCVPSHRIETFPKAFHPRVDLVGGPKVEDEHVVVAPVDYFLQAARQFGTAARGEPAL